MSKPDPVRDALADLQDAIDCEGFGCACMPDAKCATCLTRDILDKHVRKPFDKLRAALSAQPPSGWLLVPVEPTPDMCMAALVASREAGAVHGGNYAIPIAHELDAAKAVYSAMVAAAPKPEGTK